MLDGLGSVCESTLMEGRPRGPLTKLIPSFATAQQSAQEGPRAGHNNTQRGRRPTALGKGRDTWQPPNRTHTRKQSVPTHPGLARQGDDPGAGAWRPRPPPMLPYAPPTPAERVRAPEQDPLTGPLCKLCHLPVPAAENGREGVNSSARTQSS